MPYVKYNVDADATYVYLRTGLKVARTQNLDGSRLIDYAADGEPVGIELLDASEGVNLDGIPARDIVAALLEGQHIGVFTHGD